jgi:hypothetical protein
MSSNSSVRSTTAPGDIARFFPTWYGEGSTICGIRGGDAMSETNARAPRTKFIPAVSIAAFHAAGLVTGEFDGDMASMRLSTTNSTRCADAQSRRASSTSVVAVLPLTR